MRRSSPVRRERSGQSRGRGRLASIRAGAFVTLGLVCAGTDAYAAEGDAPSGAAPATAGEGRASKDEPNKQPRSDEDDEHLRIGPVVGVGFPRPFAIEGLVKVERLVAIGLEYSFMPTTKISDVETRFSALAGDLRVFPFRGAFFVGLRAGRSSLSANATINVAQLGTVTQSADAVAWFVNPRVGFLWTWKSGLSLGIDAGVQLPLSASLEKTFPSGVVPEVDDTIRIVSKTLGNGVTPTVDLLRVGFLF